MLLVQSNRQICPPITSEHSSSKGATTDLENVAVTIQMTDLVSLAQRQPEIASPIKLYRAGTTQIDLRKVGPIGCWTRPTTASEGADDSGLSFNSADAVIADVADVQVSRVRAELLRTRCGIGQPPSKKRSKHA